MPSARSTSCEFLQMENRLPVPGDGGRWSAEIEMDYGDVDVPAFLD